MPAVSKNPNPKAGHALPAVTSVQVERIRRSVMDIVRHSMPRVRKVLDGRLKWNNQQVRLFAIMLNKVMPDLHHSFNEHTVDMKAINELSIQELEEIAAMAEKVEENTIDGEAEEVTDAEVITDDEVSEILIPKRPKGPRQGDKDSEPPEVEQG